MLLTLPGWLTVEGSAGASASQGAAEYPGKREKLEAVGHGPARRAEYRRDRGAVQGNEPSAQGARGP